MEYANADTEQNLKEYLVIYGRISNNGGNEFLSSRLVTGVPEM